MNKLIYFILTLLSTTAWSQQKCNSYGIHQTICHHFEENKNKQFLTTSDGGKIPNPRFDPSTAQSSTQTSADVVVHRAAMPANEESIEESLDKYLNYQIEVEEILSQTNAAKWSKKAQKAIFSISTIDLLLKKAFPNEPGFQNYGSNVALLPIDLKDPKSKYMQPDDEYLDKVIKDIGPEALKKIRDARAKTVSAAAAKQIEQAKLYQQAWAEEQAKEEKRVKESTDRQNRLMEYSRNAVIEMIKKGRKDSDLTPEQQNLISRVKQVKLQNAESFEARNDSSCVGGAANAFYRGDRHTVTPCASVLNYPDATIVRILAHEIAHSIDPCNASCSHIQPNRETISSQCEAGQADVKNEEQEHLCRLGRRALQITGDSFMNVPGGFEGEDLQLLVKNKFLTVLQPEVPLKKQPLENVRQCLINKAGFDPITNKDIELSMSLLVANMKRLGFQPDKAYIDEARKSYQKKPECSGILHKTSETSEAMADVYSVYAVSKYVKDFPPKTPEDQIAIDAHFLPITCSPHYMSALELKTFQLSTLHERHPQEHKRVLNILLNFPGIAEGFGCDLQPDHNCFAEFSHQLSRKKVSTSTNQSEKEESKK